MHAPPCPPSSDAVDQAISLLLGDIRETSGPSERDPTEYNREREVAELELAASAIHNELLLRAALLKRQRNSSRWIYQLPQEFFTEILMIDIIESDLEEPDPARRSRLVTRRPAPRRTQLCNISHRFLQTIMSTPRLWSIIRWGRDHHTRCLQMSAQAPLSIRCHAFDTIKLRSPGGTSEFLKDVWDHSWRWKALSLRLRFDPRHLSLEFSAPQIRDLMIETFPRGSGRRIQEYAEDKPKTYALKIFGNPSLRHVSLHGIGLHWNDLGFSHLKYLSLMRIREGAPSLQKLLEILKIASGLEHLTVYTVEIIDSSNEHELDLQPFHLSSLLSLWLDVLPAGSAEHLIRPIWFPQLRSMRVRGRFIEYFENSNSEQNPYHHFLLVLGQILSCSTQGLTLSNETSSNLLLLYPNHWPENAAEKAAKLVVEVEDPLSAVQKMADFLTSNRIVVPLTIAANGYNHALNSILLATPSFPAEVLEKLPTVTNISAHVLVDALNIMNILGSIRRDEETGRLGWPCPKLEVLDLSKVDGLTPEHREAFLAARYGDGNPLVVDGEVVHKPPMVDLQYRPTQWET
ncbi:hypothetical protein FS837_011855 [Tulasnella sp. UAMH 9824]|nr:hypothetical protein FS837_011855 [Tulasnella sp. UAMH 9824]